GPRDPGGDLAGRDHSGRPLARGGARNDTSAHSRRDPPGVRVDRGSDRAARLRPPARGLQGDFAYDALSPDGHVLYLIQHVSKTSLSRYLVRAYDLRRRELRPGAIADRTQPNWDAGLADGTRDECRRPLRLHALPEPGELPVRARARRRRRNRALHRDPVGPRTRSERARRPRAERERTRAPRRRHRRPDVVHGRHEDLPCHGGPRRDAPRVLVVGPARAGGARGRARDRRTPPPRAASAAAARNHRTETTAG